MQMNKFDAAAMVERIKADYPGLDAMVLPRDVVTVQVWPAGHTALAEDITGSIC